MLEKRKELELRVEKSLFEEQLAVARVREAVFAEIDSGICDANLTGRQELPPKDSFVQVSTSTGQILLISAGARCQPQSTGLSSTILTIYKAW